MTSFFFFLTVRCHPLLSPFVLSSTTFTFFFSASTCPLIGEHLRICPQGYTCCTSNVEDKLASQSRTEVENVIKDAGRSLQISLTGQYKIFNGELFVFMMQSICLCILFFFILNIHWRNRQTDKKRRSSMIVYLKVYKVYKDLLSCFKRSNLQLTLIKTLFPFCFDISKTKHDLMQRVRTTKNEQSHLNLWWLSGLKCFIETDWAQTKDKDKHISQWVDSVLHYLMCEKCYFLYSMQMVQSVGNH